MLSLYRPAVWRPPSPFGTALPNSKPAVWKLHPEPILCFDGDQAGQKAATRAIERILPLLELEKLRIASLPAGQTPMIF